MDCLVGRYYDQIIWPWLGYYPRALAPEVANIPQTS